ncbi:NUDIX domain-containing protein [Patescibacteria group bacterium]|nr:NUDIX domain-containing protein [Patescibacteria group bacterium]MBU1663545.1 NUDIX domain-containing protein [Patescibacteria group bacterium]MBU1933807.1 NUDIX domain-containing protein [Patescibacteria group bacterium]MBU2007801.1 NUDIX domain-containing protein [Patescibacteria group bacterium]MBU2233449.1 NUDIX domain-containing protein [Patescibacteria group bacterium]
MNNTNWEKLSKGVFLVNVLGVVYNPATKMILLGRRENDPHIKELAWSFPGGCPDYENDLEDNIKAEVKIKTGLDVKVNKIIFAKTYPEKREFLSVYYLCEPTGGVEKAGGRFVEIKWIKPTDVKKYFTTSLHEKLFEFLKTLE